MPEGRRALLRCVAIDGDERSSSPTIEALEWDALDDPVIAAATPVTRREVLPALMTAWTDLPSRLVEVFGP